MSSIFNLFQRKPILTIASLLAIISMFWVPPTQSYIQYINIPVLAILFCLMVVIAAFRLNNVLDAIWARLLLRIHTLRQLAVVLTLSSFVISMGLTNDVALIALIPFTLLAMDQIKSKKHLATIIIFQTLAANLGSMCTPIGNPHNLYLYVYYQLTPFDFIALLIPYTLVSLLLLILSFFTLPADPLTSSEARKQRRIHGLPSIINKSTVILYGILFLLILANIGHLLDYRWMLGITIVLTLVKAPAYFKYVDYPLLITFVAFFIFIGNLGHIHSFTTFITDFMAGRELITSVLASQVISNVPAAVLLSPFTDNAAALIIGTNLGGLGTLIASMASLISYSFYVKADPQGQWMYLQKFTLWNVGYLLILLGLYYILN